MTDRELMQQALDALESDCGATKFGASEALRARLAQPEPDFSKAGFGKPQGEEGCAGCGKQASEGWALYCVKCSEREWVGLTDEEIESTVDEIAIDAEDKVLYPMGSFARAIEAKLKDKNT